MSKEVDRASEKYEKIKKLIGSATIEIYPDKNVLQLFETGLLKNHNIAITASPTKPVEIGLDVATTLAHMGYKVTPHLAARNIENREHLEKILETLNAENIRNVFVIGGDRKNPIGKYTKSMDLLRDIVEFGGKFESVGVAGYPEGYELIPQEFLDDALTQKQRFAEENSINMHVVTQMCFSASSFQNWLKRERERCMFLPVVYGSAGPADFAIIAKFASRIGFTESANFLRRIKLAKELATYTTSRYNPFDTLNEFTDLDSISGVRFFTFNDILGTDNWSKTIG